MRYNTGCGTDAAGTRQARSSHLDDSEARQVARLDAEPRERGVVEYHVGVEVHAEPLGGAVKDPPMCGVPSFGTPQAEMYHGTGP